MDPLWIALAFIFGLAVKLVGLPPLVGFLATGFVLHGLGIQGGETLQEIADLGVTLLLFSIGLKLKPASLLKKEIWATASVHMLVCVVLLGSGIYWLAASGFSLFAELGLGASLTLAFALSFSSTVFAVKVLEEQGEMSALYGRVAIGILIIQDILAVVFLTFSAGKIPTWWALLLIAGLPVIRWGCLRILDRCGHGELVVLFGLLLALVLGASLFEAVGLKPDIGALIIGVLVSSHPKASEVSNALLSFKDLFLVGFFLSIGLSGAPSFDTLGVALLLLPAVLFKTVLFLVLLARFSLKARTALLGSLSLANYSEFGLIVGSVAIANGWLEPHWLIVIALALSLSFVLAAPLNTFSHALACRLEPRLLFLETRQRHPEEVLIDPGEVQVAVLGMGRVGQGVYDWMRETYGDVVVGLDFNPEKVAALRKSGRHVLLGDAEDRNFWRRLKMKSRPLRLAFLTFGQSANLTAARSIRVLGGEVPLAAVAHYADEEQALRDAGVDLVFDLYAKAGEGFAEAADKAVRPLAANRRHTTKA